MREMAITLLMIALYIINLNDDDNDIIENNNHDNEENEFDNYRISDLNDRFLNSNNNIRHINNDNYFPGFSFSTSDEEENKI